MVDLSSGYELFSSVCKLLGLKRCTKIRIEYDFNSGQFPTVTAECVLAEADDQGELKWIIEQYELYLIKKSAEDRIEDD